MNEINLIVEQCLKHSRNWPQYCWYDITYPSLSFYILGYAGNSEEEELQEVLRQSRDQYHREGGLFRYQQQQQDRRRGGHSTDDNVDVQTAIQNSIGDSRGTNPLPPNDPPPPVNPHFNPSISKTEFADSSLPHIHTMSYPEDDRPNGMPGPANVATPYPDTDSLSRGPMPSGNVRPESVGDTNTIRAARLRRFDKPH